MAELFKDKSTCNPDIGNWNTAKVTTHLVTHLDWVV
jgi:hypothetical protein